MTPQLLMVVEAELRNAIDEPTVRLPGLTLTNVIKPHEELTHKQETKLYEIIQDDVDFWWEHEGTCIIDDFKTILDTFGFSGSRIFYTGFCSQGDGASLDGTYTYEKGWRDKLKALGMSNYVDLLMPELNIIADLQKKSMYDLYIGMSSRGHYSHSGSMVFDVESYRGILNNQHKRMDGVLQDMAVEFRCIADKIYRELDKRYSALGKIDYWREMRTSGDDEHLWISEEGCVYDHDEVIDMVRERIIEEVQR